jgi:hypothetical protein
MYILFSSVKFSFWVFLFLKAHMFNLLNFFVSSILMYFVLKLLVPILHMLGDLKRWEKIADAYLNTILMPDHHITHLQNNCHPSHACERQRKSHPKSTHGKKQSTNAKWTCHDGHRMMHRSSYFSCSTLMVLSGTEMQTKMLTKCKYRMKSRTPKLTKPKTHNQSPGRAHKHHCHDKDMM